MAESSQSSSLQNNEKLLPYQFEPQLDSDASGESWETIEEDDSDVEEKNSRRKEGRIWMQRFGARARIVNEQCWQLNAFVAKSLTSQ